MLDAASIMPSADLAVSGRDVVNSWEREGDYVGEGRLISERCCSGGSHRMVTRRG